MPMVCCASNTDLTHEYRFPLTETRGFEPGPFTLADYRQATRDLPVPGGALVSAKAPPGQGRHFGHPLRLPRSLVTRSGRWASS